MATSGSRSISPSATSLQEPPTGKCQLDAEAESYTSTPDLYLNFWKIIVWKEKQNTSLLHGDETVIFDIIIF